MSDRRLFPILGPRELKMSISSLADIRDGMKPGEMEVSKTQMEFADAMAELLGDEPMAVTESRAGLSGVQSGEG